MEIVKSGGLFRVDGTRVKLTKLMETVDWLINQLNEIVEELFEYFSHQHHAFQREKLAKYEEETNYFMIDWYEMKDESRPEEELEPSSAAKVRSLLPNALRRIPCMKPRTLATKLGTSRDRIYSIKREIKKQLHSKRNRFPKILKQVKFDKQTMLDTIASFWNKKKHYFFWTNDVKKHLEDTIKPYQTPSISTIRRWVKRDLNMWFKKVNIRFRECWTSEDLINKMKFLWICRSFISDSIKPVFWDKFNISNCTSKQYTWTKKGSQTTDSQQREVEN